MSYLKRLQRIRQKMQQNGIDVFLVTKPENKYYLSGFESTHYYIVITLDESYLLTDFRYLESAQNMQELFEIKKLEASFTIFDFLAKYDKIVLAIEGDHLTYHEYNMLLKNFSNKDIVDAREILDSMRMIKDKNEIRHIQKAAEIADEAFMHILDFIAPGKTEQEIGLEIEYYMKRKGASDLSFETIVASGERSSLPHGTATERIICNGDMITIDFGCIVNHYCSDMTRTIAVGFASNEQRDVYEVVKKAQLKALEKVRAGMSTTDVDKIARDVITDEGYGDYFGHGLGHGVGLEVHELPRLSPTYQNELAEGMVVTIEPGIYLPQKYGIRIEDLIVINDQSIINLTSSSKDLIIV